MNLHSDLELQVMFDMYINGYDPSNPEHVQSYWNERLS
jgi:hypothetical protein